MHFDETLEFIKYIKDKVDILHVSSGIHDLYGEPYYMRYMLQSYTMDQMFNVHYAEKVKKAYPDLIVATVGSIKDVAQAEEIIASGKADIVAMNRALHADYDMPRKFAEGREWEHMPCLRCGCFRMASPHTTKLCSVNPIGAGLKNIPRAGSQSCCPQKGCRYRRRAWGIEAPSGCFKGGMRLLFMKRGSIGGHVERCCRSFL
jgi:hypothetical protein